MHICQTFILHIQCNTIEIPKRFYGIRALICFTKPLLFLLLLLLLASAIPMADCDIAAAQNNTSNPQNTITSHLLKKTVSIHPLSLKEREAAYSAARERIFAESAGEICKPVSEKPRSVPVAARRMIAHALGQTVHSRNGSVTNRDYNEHGRQSEDSGETASAPVQNTDVYNKAKNNNALMPRARDVPQEEAKSRTVKKVYSREEHLVAAKRMFTQALGLQSPKDSSLSKHCERKQIDMS